MLFLFFLMTSKSSFTKETNIHSDYSLYFMARGKPQPGHYIAILIDLRQLQEQDGRFSLCY